MRITAITAHDSNRAYKISLSAIRGPLTAVYGPANSGKSAVADLVGHALFGKHRAASHGHTVADGELIVENRDGRYRVRASHDAHGHTRLTVSGLGGAPADHHTIRKLAGNLSPRVLTPLCTVSFRESPEISKLLSRDFALGFHEVGTDSSSPGGRRLAELAARRDSLAQELEARIATERRASKDLEGRWRELDRLIREEQHRAAADEQRLKAVENALAETDSRLRYRRLELNVELRWQANETAESELPIELEPQIARCRQMLAELSERESTVRARLSQLQSARPSSAATLAEQQTWLAVARQLSADLSGEVARLARGNTSQQCVCQDAHPRLRPIAETIERQLSVLEKSIVEQQQASLAAELTAEVDHVTRAQCELRRHLEQLLERNQARLSNTSAKRPDGSGSTIVFSAADAEQLESRRLELEQERFELVANVNSASRRLKVLRAEREAIERERAGLLSTRSIEHVQRELAQVQKKLENASPGHDGLGDDGMSSNCLAKASEILAQLTNGDICRLWVQNPGERIYVGTHKGETVSVETLTASQRDQVYLSLCLAHLSVASRQGIWLPLVLDDPFARLDARATAALAAVLEAFARQGHQVLVFTGRKEAADRLAAIGAEIYDMMGLRKSIDEVSSEAATTAAAHSTVPRARNSKRVHARDASAEVPRRKKKRAPAVKKESSGGGQSDAA
jgi:DNA repair exonuclease SbcCD ATPase subunit